MDERRNPDDARAEAAERDGVILLDAPDNGCFGCSPHNTRGLRLVWRQGEGEVRAFYTAESHFRGAPGVVHGGIQATLLDETIGVALHRAFGDPEDLFLVTADFELRYRRPVPTGRQIELVGRFERREGRSYFGSGSIVDRTGALLTSATARWVAVPAPEARARPA